MSNAHGLDDLIFTLNLLDNLDTYRPTFVLVFPHKHALKIAPRDPKSKNQNRKILIINCVILGRCRRAQNRKEVRVPISAKSRGVMRHRSWRLEKPCLRYTTVYLKSRSGFGSDYLSDTTEVRHMH